jgi:hypothetical protein
MEGTAKMRKNFEQSRETFLRVVVQGGRMIRMRKHFLLTTEKNYNNNLLYADVTVLIGNNK